MMLCSQSKTLCSLLSKSRPIVGAHGNTLRLAMFSQSIMQNCANYSLDHTSVNRMLVGRHTKRNPMLMSVRHRTTLDIHRPRIPHKDRAVFLDIVYPKYKNPLEDMPPTETCINAVKASVNVEIEENPFERILSREFLAEVEAGQMLVVLHRHHCSSEDLFDMRVQIHRSNMKYLYHNNNIARMAFKGTEYENLLSLYVSQCATIVCYDTDISKLLKLERRLPYLTMLTAVVNNRIMTMDDLRKAAALPNMDIMRATLLNTLSTQSQRLTQALQQHQGELSGLLERHASPSTTEGPPPPEAVTEDHRPE